MAARALAKLVQRQNPLRPPANSETPIPNALLQRRELSSCPKARMG